MENSQGFCLSEILIALAVFGLISFSLLKHQIQLIHHQLRFESQFQLTYHQINELEGLMAQSTKSHEMLTRIDEIVVSNFKSMAF